MKIFKPVRLSKRLQALADMVTLGNRVADVGCDHGFLSIYLVQRGIAPGVIAGDVRKGPLSAAQNHVAEYGLEAYIDTRLSDGLEKYHPGEAETLICAGMGGPLMQRILMTHREVTESFKELILQPQSELEEFRIFLRNQGFVVAEENILCEDGKYYFMFRVIPGNGEKTVCMQNEWGMKCDTDFLKEDYQRFCDKYGEQLLAKRHPILKEYLERGLSGSLAVREQLLAHRKKDESNARLERSLEENTKEIEDLRTVLAMFNEEV